MKKTIIGKSKTSLLRTNKPTSEKYDCDAYRDQKKKKEEERKRLLIEIERRDNEQ